jgi:hypothetical protein
MDFGECPLQRTRKETAHNPSAVSPGQSFDRGRWLDTRNGDCSDMIITIPQKI